MQKNRSFQLFRDEFEYDGCTNIRHIRKLGRKTVWRDWLVFNSVEEARDYFIENCLAQEAA